MGIGYPIEKIIRETLDEKRKVLSRTKTPDPYSPRKPETKKEYQKNIIKTTYMFMVSAPIFEEDEVKRGKMPSGTIILGNQEYSKNTSEQVYAKDLYNSRSKIPYRPNAGVTSLSSEYISSNNVQFVRHITINWSCFSLEDLEELGERFLTLGRKVYVEWGWTQDKKDRPALIDKKGQVIDIKSNPDENESEATRLRNKVIQEGKGEFDATIGWVNNFNWTSREDGGFDCTTELTVQGINALDGPTNLTDSHNDDGKKKFKENTSSGFSGFGFKEALQNLPETMAKLVLGRKLGGDANNWEEKSKRTLQSYTEVGDMEQEIVVKGSAKNQEEKIKNIYRDITIQDEGIISDNNNFILTANETITGDKKESFDNSLISYNVSTIKSQALTFDPLDGTKTTFTKSYPPEKAWVRWGWFEDNVINRFFALIEPDGTPVSWFRSIESTGNRKIIWTKDGYQNSKSYIEVETFIRDATQEEYDTSDWKDSPIRPRYGDLTREQSNLYRFFIDHIPITAKTHPSFITTDINKFIFPGKFTFLSEEEKTRNVNRRKTLSEKVRRLKSGFVGDFGKKIDEAEDDEEKKRAEEIKRYEQQLTLSEKFEDLASFQTGSIGDILKETNALQDKGFIPSVENTDFVETGMIPYIYLYQLSETFKELPKNRIFVKEDSIDGTDGIIRNIFINVKHLQDIFSNQSATLGENMNALFDSLTTETGGLTDLMIVANPNEVGLLQVTPRGINTEEAKKIDNLKQKGAIYQFPVWQNDSLVKSQELSSDISGDNYKILLSKAYDERIKFEKKKGISLEHHAQISEIDSKGNVKEEDKQYEGVLQGIKPAFTQEGYENYGEPDGNEDYPLADTGPSVVPEYIETLYGIDTKKKSREGASEKDLESRNSVFKELDVAYTANGRLKKIPLENMKEETKFREIVREEYDGEKYITKLPNIDDYGMVGLTNTLSITGIAGIYPSNVFTTTYLPQKFKNYAHFYATDVGQSIDSSDWTTTIAGRMVWKYQKTKPGQRKKQGEEGYEEEKQDYIAYLENLPRYTDKK